MEWKASLGAAVILLAVVVHAVAEVEIRSLDRPVTINFDETLRGVNRGPWEASGLSPDPQPGELDSTAWSFAGWPPGNYPFGGIDYRSDLMRGSSGGSVASPGIYAWTLNDNHALGWQLPNSQEPPWQVGLCIRNHTSATVQSWQISYDMLTRNDQPGSAIISLWYSTDNQAYLPFDEAFSVTPTTAASLPTWERKVQTARCSATVEPNGRLYLRWTIESPLGIDADELGLDNIRIVAHQPVEAPNTGSLKLIILECLGLAGLLFILLQGRK